MGYSGVMEIEQVLLRSPNGASAKVNLHGAQVVSWRNERGEELLFTSNKVRNQKAMIMGGIPICFPQFGNCGSNEQHGFARNKVWRIDDDPPALHTNPNDSCRRSFVDLVLKSSDDELKCWPHSFEFRLKVALSTKGELMLMSRIRNVNGKAFSFSFGYHTHLSVSDISKDRRTRNSRLLRQPMSQRTIHGARRCHNLRIRGFPPNVVAILDHERKRTYIVRKEGLPDFDPWEKKSKAKSNFGDEEYKQMVCVDGAAIEKQITLKPGEEWTGRIQISAVPSSFCNL
ncbi:Putative glucose-6-phosphate 1-epimerase [Linum perenne]